MKKDNAMDVRVTTGGVAYLAVAKEKKVYPFVDSTFVRGLSADLTIRVRLSELTSLIVKAKAFKDSVTPDVLLDETKGFQDAHILIPVHNDAIEIYLDLISEYSALLLRLKELVKETEN